MSQIESETADSSPLQAPEVDASAVEGTASIGTASFNLANTVLGAGILTLPYSMMKCGWGLGLLFLALVGASSALSFILLTISSQYTQAFRYRTIAQKLYGPVVSQIIAVLVLIYTFGTTGSYCIVIRDNMFWWAERTPRNDLYKKLLLWGFMLFIILPLSLLPRIDFLNFTSLIALVSIFYVICVIAAFYFITNFDPTQHLAKGPPVLFNFSVDAFTAFPLLTTAFCGHYNSLNIYQELRGRSVRRMSVVVWITVLVSSAFNVAMALFGYFTFTDTLDSDILRNVAEIPGASVFFSIANGAMIVVLLFSYPLLSFGAKGTVESMIFRPGTKVPYKWGALITLFNVLLPALVATFIDSISVILSFTSSLCGAPMVFIIPGFFGLTVLRKSRGPTYLVVLSVILIALGFVYMVSGFAAAIYGVI